MSEKESKESQSSLTSPSSAKVGVGGMTLMFKTVVGDYGFNFKLKTVVKKKQ